jgi:two-component system, OmpR family, phosphate regulon sensor histidine kinase PhoR
VKIYQSDIDKNKIKLKISIPKDKNLKIESKHFSILWSNLLKNAITYNKNGGNITIDYSGKILSITDTGIGMKEEDTRKIFDRFYRIDRTGTTPGTGIGLALVDRITKLYGWGISVQSVLGEGTTFRIKTK